MGNYLRVVMTHFPKKFKWQLECIFIGIAILMRTFHSSKEKRLYARKIAHMPLPESPIFIVGHPRSGTTHLHNLLSQDPQFGTAKMKHAALPWDFLDSFSIWIHLVESNVPETRRFDKVTLGKDTSQEEEMALGNMGNICSYYSLYFPQSAQKEYRRAILLEGVSVKEKEDFAQRYCYFLKKLMLDGNEGKRLLLKNPANTGARIGFLKKLFPRAQFIHIYRNPFEVFVSMINNVKKTLPIWNLQPYSEDPIEKDILENYVLMYQRFFKEADLLARDDLYQLSFENLERDPVAEIKKIYEQLNLSGFDVARPSIEDYCQELTGYEKNNHSISERQMDLIRHKWAFTLKHWGYDLPPSLTIRNDIG